LINCLFNNRLFKRSRLNQKKMLASTLTFSADAEIFNLFKRGRLNRQRGYRDNNMYQIKVNDQFDFGVDKTRDGLLVNNSKCEADIKQLNPTLWHVIDQLRSYNAEVISFDKALKTAEIRINNNIYTVTAKDRFDLLLEKMGLTNLNSAKISELKAPMPGMVLKVFVETGAIVTKGDNLFILEAMKMENIIKSPADAVINSVKIKPGDKVEKGQILLQFA
jgi:biotin carboxyl carrier protein